MMKNNQLVAIAVAAIAFSLVSFSANAVVIDNGLATNQQGYWSVDVGDGGESVTAFLTGTGVPSGTVFQNSDVVWQLLSFFDVGTGGVLLSSTNIGSAASLTNPGEVTSSGDFTGALGNTIDWVMVSTINAGSTIMTNELTLTAQTGTLDTLDFYQYLDADVLGPSGDFVFSDGSAGGSDLRIVTIDFAEAIGVGLGGAQSGGQGLVNSSFSGWAADAWNGIAPMIITGTQLVSPSGVIGAALAGAASAHPIAGPGYGPADIVSAMAWDVDPTATTATIVTTITGVPNIYAIAETIPVPALDTSMLALLTLLLGVGGVIAIRRQIN